jgi:hypothetical protein
LAARAGFSLYVLDAPLTEFNPVVMRESSVPTGRGREITLFVLQYRVPAVRGGGIVIVLSSPSHGSLPQRNDLDDGLDAVRLFSRLPPTPSAGDPLADPERSLSTLGCPVHADVSVTVAGRPQNADVETWPGAPGVLFLRAQTPNGDVQIETGGIDRASTVGLAGRLVALQDSPRLVRQLQALFDTVPVSVRSPTPRPR